VCIVCLCVHIHTYTCTRSNAECTFYCRRVYVCIYVCIHIYKGMLSDNADLDGMLVNIHSCVLSYSMRVYVCIYVYTNQGNAE